MAGINHRPYFFMDFITNTYDFIYIRGIHQLFNAIIINRNNLVGVGDIAVFTAP